MILAEMKAGDVNSIYLRMKAGLKGMNGRRPAFMNYLIICRGFK
jgi:hypothetical protein